MYQRKEQDKNPQTQLNEEEIGNLPEEEIRVMIAKMIQDFEKKIEIQREKLQEMFNEFVRIKGVTKAAALTDVLEMYMLASDETLYLDLKKKYLNTCLGDKQDFYHKAF